MRLPKTIRQLALLARETLTLRQVLVNRFTALVLVVLVVSVSGYVYVNANDDGELTGVVVDGTGEPVANATVVLRTESLSGVPTNEETRTDGDGEFLFSEYGSQGQATLEFRVTAHKLGVGTSGRCHRHVYFPNQNVRLELYLDGRECASSV